ncbi:MAG TPA: hypothetical protein VII94_03850 [Candidatus Saccharimonadales bacterium]
MAPKFESPIGSKQFNGPVMKDFTVPDNSGPQPPPQQRRRDNSPPPFDEAALQEFQSRMQPSSQSHPMAREVTEVEKEFSSIKRERREGKERLSEGAKRRIEMLIEMTRATKEIEVEGKLYKLQSLSSQELREAVTASIDFNGTIQYMFENRKQLLARSLTIVAGVDIDQFLSSSDLEARLEFIELLDHALLVRLFDEYVILAQGVQDKYAIKTETQVKEVLEDLKKP